MGSEMCIRDRRYALRLFIVEVRAGRIDLDAEQDKPEPAKKRLKMPS